MLFLLVIWVLLREDASLFTILTGVIICFGCIIYSRFFLPLNPIKNVKFHMLIPYLLYLFGQIYISGFYVIKMILKGKARADIMDTKTLITNEALRVMLADSITLTPGSILLDLSEDVIKVVVLMSEDDPQIPENVDEIVKGRLEVKLLEAQK